MLSVDGFKNLISKTNNLCLDILSLNLSPPVPFSFDKKEERKEEKNIII